MKADNLNLGAGLSLVLMIFIVINMLFSNGDDTGVGTVEKGAKK